MLKIDISGQGFGFLIQDLEMSAKAHRAELIAKMADDLRSELRSVLGDKASMVDVEMNEENIWLSFGENEWVRDSYRKELDGMMERISGGN